MAKRVRHSMKSAEETAHVWASQDPECTWGKFGNVNFSGNRIYSYRWWVMAVINPDGVVLMRNWNYSVSTSGHMSAVRGAITHKKVIYCANPDDVEESLKGFIREMKESFRAFDNARKKSRHITSNEETYTSLKAYCKYMKVKVPKEARKYRLDTKKFEELIRIEGEKEADARERYRLKEEALQDEADKRNEEIQKNLGTLSPEEAWLEGLTVTEGSYWYVRKLQLVLYHRWNGYVKFDETKLRIMDDKVETSRGAYIPVKDGKRLWNLIKNKSNIHGEKIGHYSVVGWNGSLRVGCHEISRGEMGRFLLKYGWDTKEVINQVLGLSME